MEEPVAKYPKLSSFNPSELDEQDSVPILDTRFQSYLRLYIFDLNNADPCEQLNHNSSKKPLIRINDLYVSKVCVCGNIVNIFESAKYYRLKIDDSTGCINVTLWKDSIFTEDSLSLTSSSYSTNVQNQFSHLYSQINSIQARIKESSVNNYIQYEPKQGDLVLIRAHARPYKQRIELNAISCIRVKNSSEELVQMVLPTHLFDKIYSKKSLSFDQYVKVNKKIQTVDTNEPKSDKENIFTNEKFLNYVFKKLIEMTDSSILDQSRRNENSSAGSCESFKLYRFLRSNCPNEFKCSDHKQVLDALKELESRGLVYSCEDEYHYLPLK